MPELIVADLESSLRFYLGVLDFRVRYTRHEERFALVEREGVELMLEQPTTKDRLWPKAELSYPYGRGVNFEIHVSDVEPLHEAVIGAGLPIFLPLESKWYRRAGDEVGVRQFAVQDPDGYLLRFSQKIGTRPIR